MAVSIPQRAHAHVYWQLDDDLAIGATEKAALTSIQFALNRCRRLTPEQVHQRKLRVRLYLRHPITRFASAYAYFAPNANFPIQRSRPADLLASRLNWPEKPTLHQFTDAVLAGMWNEHWGPQLEQHDAVGIDELHQLEQIDETWPKRYPLTHQNKGRMEKPIIIYRVQDLEDYYKRDLIAWHEVASPNP